MNPETIGLAFGAAVLATTATPTPPVPDLSQGLTLGAIVQIVMLIIGIGGALYGLRERMLATRRGEQTVEKTKFDGLVEQNEQHIKTNRRQRAASERYWIARGILLHTPEGHIILQKTEDIADKLELPELDPDDLH